MVAVSSSSPSQTSPAQPPATAAAALSGRALQFSIGSLSRVAPAAAAVVAERLWFTPRHFALTPRERAHLQGALSVLVDTRVGPVQTWEWSPQELPWDPAPRSTVLLLHGWEGRGAQLCAFAAPLLARGHRVVAIDGPAHGRSKGDGSGQSNLIQFAHALTDVAAARGDVRAVIAHSMGGGALQLAHAEGLALDAAVTIGAPAAVSRVARRFASLVGLHGDGERAFHRRVERRLGDGVWQRIDAALASDKLTARALVIHDDHDDEVPPSEAVHLHGAWPASRLWRTQGLGHRRILRDPEVIEAVAAFVDETLGDA
jgi:pimeloyl-ACP methyl ester carboxylesterase